MRREQAKTLVEQQKAETAYQRERQRAEEAEARFRLARRSVDELIRVSEEELAHRPGMEGLRKRLLASALAFYQEFIEQRKSDPAAQAELRDTTRRVETILADLAVLAPRGSCTCWLSRRPMTTCGSTKARERRWPTYRSGPGGDGHRRSATQRTGARQRSVRGWRSNRREPTRRRSTRSSCLLSACGCDRLRFNRRGRRPSASQRSWRRSASRPLSASGSARSRRSSSCAARGPQSGKATEEADKPAIERILAVLDSSQVGRWKEMAGEPIRGRLAVFPMPLRPQRDSRRAPR